VCRNGKPPLTMALPGGSGFARARSSQRTETLCAAGLLVTRRFCSEGSLAVSWRTDKTSASVDPNAPVMRCVPCPPAALQLPTATLLGHRSVGPT
jgi:hypothetical protein